MAKRTKPQTELGVYTRIFVAENHGYRDSDYFIRRAQWAKTIPMQIEKLPQDRL